MTNQEIAQKLLEFLELKDEQISIVYNGKMTDITAPEAVEIQIREDGKTIWVNVDGMCILRCCKIKNLELADLRRSNDTSTN